MFAEPVIGYAYGNSATLPFVKAFFAGGTNDIRAFRARGLGPGTYYAGNAAIVGFLPDQPGDIKLELNTEFRAKLFSVIYGAVFIDAGNIWLLKDNPQTPGGKFTNKFLNDFAVGTGAGLLGRSEASAAPAAPRPQVPGTFDPHAHRALWGTADPPPGPG